METSISIVSNLFDWIIKQGGRYLDKSIRNKYYTAHAQH
jgi:hypothetical protein